ncbi:MAG: hypothetical protein ACI9WS_003516, partial [Paraglaciecola psychrophila]
WGITLAVYLNILRNSIFYLQPHTNKSSSLLLLKGWPLANQFPFISWCKWGCNS